MPDPISSTILATLFKKIVDLCGDLLSTRFPLKTPEDRQRLALKRLYEDLKRLQNVIDHFLVAINLLAENPESFHEADHMLEKCVIDARILLLNISQFLHEFSTEFEIMAQDAASTLDIFIVLDGGVVDELGLLLAGIRNNESDTDKRESLDSYRIRIQEIGSLGTKARSALADFIRATYSYGDFAK